MQHGKRQRSPVPAVGVDGGVLGRGAWNLENTTDDGQYRHLSQEGTLQGWVNAF